MEGLSELEKKRLKSKLAKAERKKAEDALRAEEVLPRRPLAALSYRVGWFWPAARRSLPAGRVYEVGSTRWVLGSYKVGSQASLAGQRSPFGPVGEICDGCLARAALSHLLEASHGAWQVGGAWHSSQRLAESRLSESPPVDWLGRPGWLSAG